MHVDGAVTSNVLAVPESVLLQKVYPSGEDHGGEPVGRLDQAA
jgi:hypothetical protein